VTEGLKETKAKQGQWVLKGSLDLRGTSVTPVHKDHKGTEVSQEKQDLWDHKDHKGQKVTLDYGEHKAPKEQEADRVKMEVPGRWDQLDQWGLRASVQLINAACSSSLEITSFCDYWNDPIITELIPEVSHQIDIRK
tara:strand:- start:117 stop:527 length:411 start_codon:yes stop_codon:yes gene_type:complete